MSSVLSRLQVGLALLAVLAAGCSSASASHPAARQHQATSPAAQPSTSSIPQRNGGDHDADNNGGPDDGDGNL